MKNNYGNYVIQKILNLTTGKVKEDMVINILINIEKLNDKKLLVKWFTLLEENVDNVVEIMVHCNMKHLFCYITNKSLLEELSSKLVLVSN
jgi:hypothetical protein